MARKKQLEGRPKYNLFVHPSGKDVIVKITLNDEVIDEKVGRNMYMDSSRRIECLETKKGLNCRIK